MVSNLFRSAVPTRRELCDYSIVKKFWQSARTGQRQLAKASWPPLRRDLLKFLLSQAQVRWSCKCGREARAMVLAWVASPPPSVANMCIGQRGLERNRLYVHDVAMAP